MQNVRSQKCTVAECGNLNKNEISKNRGVWTKIGSKLERKKRLQNHLFLHTNQSANLASLSKFSNQWLLVLDSLFIFFFGFFSPKFSSHEKKKILALFEKSKLFHLEIRKYRSVVEKNQHTSLFKIDHNIR